MKGAALAEELLHLGLHDLHVSLGGRMVPFAGYAMPVQYPAGVMTEHLHTRAAAGLFDVSHMGQVILRPKTSMQALALFFPSNAIFMTLSNSRKWPKLKAIHRWSMKRTTH